MIGAVFAARFIRSHEQALEDEAERALPGRAQASEGLGGALIDASGAPPRCQKSTKGAEMPASLMAAIPALPALLLGFFLMQTGNTFQGTILSIRGEIEGFTPGANRRGRGGLLGRRHYRIVARRGSDPAGWPHSNLRGLRSNRRHRAARAPSRGGSVRVDRGASADRILFRRHVHCRRELAERRRELRKQRTDSKHLRHDRIARRHRRPASSAHDRSSGLPGVLHHRLHHFARPCADRFDPGRRARASRRR